MESKLEKQETLEKVRWVITLRNVAIGVAVFLGVIAAYLARALEPLAAGVIFGVMAFIYNNAGRWYLKRKEIVLNSDRIILLCFAQILADVVVITLLIHVTGGILSPFVLLYLFGIVLMGFVAPEKPYFVQLTAILIVLFYEGILSLEFYRILPPLLIIRKGVEIYADLGFFMYFMVIFPAFIIVAVFMSAHVARFLSGGKKALAEQVEKLNGVRRHLESALSESGKKTSEISILYEFSTRGVYPLEQFAARLAEIVRSNTVEILLFENGDKIKTAAACGYPAPENPPATLEVPLMHGNIKIGKLKFGRPLKMEFSEDEKRILTILADRLAGEIVHNQTEARRLALEKELKGKLSELEEFHKLAVGRELKMIELEKEIERLKKEEKS